MILKARLKSINSVMQTNQIEINETAMKMISLTMMMKMERRHQLLISD